MSLPIEKLKRIKLVAFDIDGVFTNGQLHVTPEGKQFKSYHAHDGLGIVMLLRTPVEVAVISGCGAPGVHERMTRLGIKHIYLGENNKLQIYESLLAKLNLTAEQSLFVGDDIPDIPLLRKAGLGVAVANASPWVKEHASLQTQMQGGAGAVREVCEWIMHAQGTLQDQLAFYE